MRNPLRRRASADTPTDPKAPAQAPADPKAPAEPSAEGSKPAASTEAGESAPSSAAAAKEPQRASSDPHERIDGLRAWLAQVDRKLGVRSYAGGAAIVLALAAGIVGVVLALSAKDESATKDEVRALQEELGTVTEEASSAAAEEVSTLSDRVSALEEQISGLNGDQTTLERQLEVVQDDIDELRSQQQSDSNPGNAFGPNGPAGSDGPSADQ